MSKTNKLNTQKPEVKRDNTVSHTQKKERVKTKATPVDQVLHLQRTIGNQAVQRLFKSGALQAKLKIGKPNDKYEKEADRVAEQVMSIPETKVSRQAEEEEEEEEPIQTKLFSMEPPTLQRQVEPEEEEEEEEPIQAKLLSAENPVLQKQEEEEEEEPIQTKSITEQITPLIQRQAESEKEEEEESVQPKSNSSTAAEVTPGIETSINSLKGGGQPLPESTRSYFEPRFGYDFSGVKVHTGDEAAKTAKSINARAFTIGNDVMFGASNYSPETGEGKKLLAHELTHVMQQESTFYCKLAQSQTGNLPKQKLEQEVPARSSGMNIGVQRQAGESGGAYGGIVAKNAKDIEFWENLAKKYTYSVPIPIPTEWKAGVGMGFEREIMVELRSGERFGDYVFIMRNSNDKYQIYFKYKSNVIRKTDLSWWKKSLLEQSKDNLLVRQKLRSYAIRKKEKEEPPVMRISTKIYFDYNKWEPKWPATVDDAAVEIEQYLNFPTFLFPESIAPSIGKRYVRILGFASQEGPLASNQRLSQKRADRVKKLLEDRGIPSNKLIAKGMGVSVLALRREPIGYWRDRRVIFVLDPPIGVVPEY